MAIYDSNTSYPVVGRFSPIQAEWAAASNEVIELNYWDRGTERRLLIHPLKVLDCLPTRLILKCRIEEAGSSKLMQLHFRLDRHDSKERWLMVMERLADPVIAKEAEPPGEPRPAKRLRWYRRLLGIWGALVAVTFILGMLPFMNALSDELAIGIILGVTHGWAWLKLTAGGEKISPPIKFYTVLGCLLVMMAMGGLELAWSSGQHG